MHKHTLQVRQIVIFIFCRMTLVTHQKMTLIVQKPQIVWKHHHWLQVNIHSFQINEINVVRVKVCYARSTIFQLYRGGFRLLSETGVTGENYRPVASHWQTWSHKIVSSTPHHS